MVAQLTKPERQSLIAIILGVLLLGAVLAVAGLRDPLGIHGLLIVGLSLGGLLYLLARYDSPEPNETEVSNYYDDPTRVGIAFTMAWAVFGMFMGVLVPKRPDISRPSREAWPVACPSSCRAVRCQSIGSK